MFVFWQLNWLKKYLKLIENFIECFAVFWHFFRNLIEPIRYNIRISMIS